jgi:hypothetical protein
MAAKKDSPGDKAKQFLNSTESHGGRRAAATLPADRNTFETAAPIDSFISRWTNARGSERANCQTFINELCNLLDVSSPNPSGLDSSDNAYVFERRITFQNGDGSESPGFIDCYKRGSFVLEAKGLQQPKGKGFDNALLKARCQAEGYARALPTGEGRPPFLLVVDVGNVIEVYAEFSRSGGTYIPFPDARSHRLTLDDLHNEAIRERLRSIWTDPLSLDPTRIGAAVTRKIAETLAQLAKSLEQVGHSAEVVAAFLTRCIFSMFAEDVELLPRMQLRNGAVVGAFVYLIETYSDQPDVLAEMMGDLWRAMDCGEFSPAVATKLMRFNGKLFKNPKVLKLDKNQVQMLKNAATSDWKLVEPAIFGTLLERALEPSERHSLGAHYTPRAYVERLVLPTIIEPLREDWSRTLATALLLAGQERLPQARAEVRRFLRALCQVRILDPACGSGNFLYVTLEHLKRLEGEILNTLHDLGDTQRDLEADGLTVDPHQFLGIEVNPRAAAVAELVLWIGYLQWHFRTVGNAMPPEPVLKDFRNIQCRDAVLAYDKVEPLLDGQGKSVTRWDGRTTKTHPITGKAVPDESAREPVMRYINARKADWPDADFIVGNPPFIGASTMRAALGDGYVDVLRDVWTDVPSSSDFVMYWWHHAAEQVRMGRVRRFGLITTNSSRQIFSRRLIEHHLTAEPALSLAFAIPDHPWVDSKDGAAVRISMTVGASARVTGKLLIVSEERPGDGEGVTVELHENTGTIHSDLRIGANVANAHPLQANLELSNRGVQLFGAGFIITQSEAKDLGLGRVHGLERHVRNYRNGRDLTDRPRNAMVIDMFGLSAEAVRSRYPEVYQWLLERVKPERDQNNRPSRRDNWWLFGETNPKLRRQLAGLARYVVTVETAKHRTFQFLSDDILPDNMLVAIAVEDAYILGVLSSSLHLDWALAVGGRLGVGNDPRYNKTRCFETFPFPPASASQKSTIRNLAEQIDLHRKHQQQEYPDLTLTGMYNVLEKLRSGEALNQKERLIHNNGLVSVLRDMHDQLDLAVLGAYGWQDLRGLLASVNAFHLGDTSSTGTNREVAKNLLSEKILDRLVTLNSARAAEEANRTIRWLRPDYQSKEQRAQEQIEIDLPDDLSPARIGRRHKPGAGNVHPIPWPSSLPDQVGAVVSVLSLLPAAASIDDIAGHFNSRGTSKKRLPDLVDMLVVLGRAREVPSNQGSPRYISA